MIFWIVEDGQYKQYHRRGECNQCGKCCCTHLIKCQIQLTHAVPEQGDSTVANECDDLSDWEGYSAFRAQGLWFWIKCETLEKPREELCSMYIDGKCEGWKKDDFPAICRYWPVHSKDLEKFPDCGFRFEKLAEVVDAKP